MRREQDAQTPPWERVSRTDLLTAIRVLQAFSGKPNFDVDTTGKVLGDLQEELEFSERRGQEHKSFWGKIGTALFGDKRTFEATHTLGIHPSIPSGTGWQISHPLLEQNIVYEVNPQGHTEGISPSDYYGLPFIKIDKYNTSIAPEVYTDSLGKRKIILSIWKNSNEMRIHPDSYNYSPLERWIINNELTEESDSRVVIFHNNKVGITYYFQLQPALEGRAVGIVEVLPVPTSK